MLMPSSIFKTFPAYCTVLKESCTVLKERFVQEERLDFSIENHVTSFVTEKENEN